MWDKPKFITMKLLMAVIQSGYFACFIKFEIACKLKKISSANLFSYKSGNILQARRDCMRIDNHAIKLISSCRFFLSIAD